MLVIGSNNKVTGSWSAGPADVTYECQFTSGTNPPAGAWFACASGTTHAGQNGAHTFYVRAVRGGVASTPASQYFTA